MTSSKREAAPGIDPIQAWEQEAAEKARRSIEQGASLEHGDVIPRNPALRYVVIDGQLPAGVIARYRASREALGYRDVSAEVESVVGYTSFVVYAIPIAVYRDVIRPERIRRLREKVDRFGISMGQVQRVGADLS